jgi:hypothetical protein
MLMQVMAAEALKYRRTLVPWLAVSGGVFPAFVALLFLLTGGAAVTWNALAVTGLVFMNMLALLLVAVFAGHAFVSEYHGGRINGLLAYPVPRLLLYVGKLLVLSLPVLCMYIVFLASTAVFGALFVGVRALEQGFALDMLGLVLLAAVVAYALVPLTALVGMVVKNAGGYILAGICYFILFMCFAGSEYGRYITPCVSDALLKAYTSTGRLVSAEDGGMLAVCVAVFFITACIGAAWYARREP